MTAAPYRIILASASPRRRELLQELIPDFQVIPSDVSEAIPAGTPPHLACMFNALKKSMDVALSLTKGSSEDGLEDRPALVIGSDTIVYADAILGKPQDEEDAFRTLQFLRGRAHQVFTGVGLVSADASIRRVFYDCTEVVFGDYSDEQIRAYIRSGEPMDKAGSYGIQGAWREHVTAFRGSLSNVIGLPVERLREALSGAGVLPAWKE